MNRNNAPCSTRAVHVPHASGDEPTRRGRIKTFTEVMFPTRVGMNRVSRLRVQPSADVPHASGDEPLNTETQLRIGRYMFSPREWG